MDEPLLIGVDIGTQGTKAALYSAGGDLLAEAFFPSELLRPDAGTVEEDPERQLKSVCTTVRECVAQAAIDAKSVAGLCIAGQMAGIIGIGKDGRNVTPYDSWLDTRCAPYIERMDREAGRRIIEKTGSAPSFNHGPKILWWMHERPEAFNAICSFVQPAGYVAMRLCGLEGRQAFVDHTYLHFSGFADNRNSLWDTELCSRFGLDPKMFPEIVEPNRVVGEMVSDMARACGLNAAVPVVAGCGDTAASFLSCGAAHEGVCVDVAGTASVFASTTSSFAADVENRILACSQSAVPGLWHPYAYINGGGMNLEWFCREIANGGEEVGSLTLAELDRRANLITDPKEVPLFIPHLAGRVNPSMPYLRGAWVGMEWSHTLSHLYRGILEGVALEYGIYKSILEELYPELKLEEVRITGGGERSDLWNSIKASVLSIPVVRLRGAGGAPMGAAILAGFGTGLFENLDDTVKGWLQYGDRSIPEEVLRLTYEEKLRQYRSLIDVLDDFSKP